MTADAAFYQVSLIAAFVAGIVALFAPCCISYLLPAYLGNVFKEKKKILLMTGVYSAGIFSVMLPIVLGAQALAIFFFNFHTETYLIGAVTMLASAALSLLGIKLPVPHWTARPIGQTDILSTFTLGLIAGVTSACCAPVLIGVAALGSLAPSPWQALVIGLAFVGGMVTPLYLAALAIKRGNLLDRPLLNRRLFFLSLGNRRFPIFITNLISAVMFFALGATTLGLVFTGNLSMPAGPSKIVSDTAWWVTRLTTDWPFVNIAALTLLVYAFHHPACHLFKKLLKLIQPRPVKHMPQNQPTKIIYACPMHPQIRQEQPGSCSECGMRLVKTDASGADHGSPDKTGQELGGDNHD